MSAKFIDFLNFQTEKAKLEAKVDALRQGEGKNDADFLCHFIYFYLLFMLVMLTAKTSRETLRTFGSGIVGIVLNVVIFSLLIFGQPWHSGIALDCRSTGCAIDPAPVA